MKRTRQRKLRENKKESEVEIMANWKGAKISRMKKSAQTKPSRSSWNWNRNLKHGNSNRQK